MSAFGTSARQIMRLGACMLLAAASAGIWEVLASQAPGSALYLGVLPGPIERLRREAFDVGLLLWIAGLWVGERALRRRVLRCLALGAALVLVAGGYAAATGMTGVQLSDLRPDAAWVFWGKLLGRALLLFGMVELSWPALVSGASTRRRGER